MLREGDDRFLGLCVGSALDLDDVEFAAVGCWKLVQSLRGSGRRVADGGDDCGVRS